MESQAVFFRILTGVFAELPAFLGGLWAVREPPLHFKIIKAKRDVLQLSRNIITIAFFDLTKNHEVTAMIMEKVLVSAQDYLAGKTVRDLVVGISLTACELDGGDIGVSYVLRDSLPNGCSVFPYAREAIGRPASEIAEWINSGGDNLQRGIAAAVLSAASRGQEIPDDTDAAGQPFGLEVKPGDTVGMIGYIVPVAEKLARLAGRMIIFDEGATLHGGDSSIYPTAEQPRLLPECDIVILSGTTVINQSIDSLLSMCAKSREIVMVGASTPMFPEGWAGSRVTRLAGSWWNSAHKEEIFRRISLACGIAHLKDFVILKNVNVTL